MNTQLRDTTASIQAGTEHRDMNFLTVNYVIARMPVAISNAGPVAEARGINLFNNMTEYKIAHTSAGDMSEDAWAIAQNDRNDQFLQAWFPRGLTLLCDEDAWSFARRVGLTQHIMDYIVILDRCFNLIEKPVCRLVQDPENEDLHLVVYANIQAELNSLVASENMFRDILIKSLPGDALYFIRLSYNIN